MSKITTMKQYMDKMYLEGSHYDVALYLQRLPEDFEDKEFRDTFNAFAQLAEDIGDMAQEWLDNHPEYEDEEVQE